MCSTYVHTHTHTVINKMLVSLLCGNCVALLGQVCDSTVQCGVPSNLVSHVHVQLCCRLCCCVIALRLLTQCPGQSTPLGHAVE